MPSSTSQGEPRPNVVLLTKRLAAGDEEGFRQFHGLYFDRLHQFLMGVTRGDTHATADALQETLLRVVRHARRFESEDVFWGWLRAIAKNAARDGGRKERRYIDLLRRYLTGAVPHPPTNRDSADHWKDSLEEALNELDPSDQSLVRGKYLFGASVADLSESTGLSEKAVESRLHRLRQELAGSIVRILRLP